MQYRTMEKNSDAISVLGFGAMRFPVANRRIDRRRAAAQLELALRKGVNYIDTAVPYHGGESEAFLGDFLSERGLRDSIRLATKLPPWNVKKAADMEQILTAQLDKLQTDRIDYYLLHCLNRDNWARLTELGVLEFLRRELRRGRIRYAGFSFHGDRETFKRIVDAYDWTFCQIQLNYLDTEIQAGLEGLEYAAAKRLGVIIMEPLRGGLLVKRVPPTVQAVWDSAPVWRNPAEWALRWLWNRPEVTCVLSGMNEESQIEENTRIAGEVEPGSMSDEELAVVERAGDAYRALMKVACTSCGYCMPCPAGVDIPACFELYNQAALFDDARSAGYVYAGRILGITRGKTASPSQCTRCGACVTKCPQGIEIPDRLDEVRKRFEGWKTRAALWLMKGFVAIQRLVTLRRARRAKRDAEKTD